MSSDRQYLRLKKLVGRDIVRVASKHNLRELQAELGAGSHIDHTRIGLNRVVAGPDRADDVAAEAERLMHSAGVARLRRDAVRGVEIIVSLPSSSTIDPESFFSESLAWVQGFFSVPVLSAVIHLDEAAPHFHVLLLPLVDGRMAGSDLVGNRTRLHAMQTSFFEQVGRGYGLTRPKVQKRLNPATRNKAASLIMTALQSSPEMLLRPEVENALLDLLKPNPAPMLTALSLPMPLREMERQTFVGIMTKPCKPEKPIGLGRDSKPIGFAEVSPKKRRSLSCVGFARKPSPLPDPESHPEETSSEEFTRCHDDVPSAYWDSERGEYRLPAVPTRQTQLG
ncbi:hypothetical protein Tbd_2002 [Thiobacillus denitrificans ATCC 25259]|uniref:Plasmid recombination enzyme n=1 Tax=Thiobacillus denitrificans (strain ATCC 25259 / T1) TaxID=292415 RepID=Q3SHD1_THIDA|nr:plasmid recombination protein [Thiobacillus denitrificans]AAZ97955.1 hypothetical protein Tbd_2002 [Thiobacillus denitrificans ATCC 25259]